LEALKLEPGDTGIQKKLDGVNGGRH